MTSIQITSISIKELKEMLKEAATTAVKDYVQTLTVITKGDEWLTKSGAAEYAKCSTGTIDGRRRDGLLPTHFFGDEGSPMFKKSDVDAVFRLKKAS